MGGQFKDDGTKDLRERVWERGRFWGYQMRSIQPNVPGVEPYMEGGRGFLHTQENKVAKKAFKPEQWNHFRIIANGDHFQTWLNGVPVADMHDDLTASGYIALQTWYWQELGKKRQESDLA